ncbi:MAG: hypothetical protein N2V75_00650 [Methanophagales archaeon]|nr:hypothetical protein [Methanophagales archaeon]
MKTPLIAIAFLLIIIATVGFIGNNNVEKGEVATGNIPETADVKIYERPAGGWELSLLVYDPRDGVATPSGVDPESIQVMLNGIDITEEVDIKLVKEDPAYRLSINRYWTPGEYNITLVVSDYAGNRAVYKYILVFS